MSDKVEPQGEPGSAHLDEDPVKMAKVVCEEVITHQYIDEHRNGRFCVDVSDFLGGIEARRSAGETKAEKRHKASQVGAPVIFILDQACRQINEAYAYCEHAQVYQVGSSLVRPDWRDVDLRMMMSDADFEREFPDAHDNGAWEMDSKWALLTAAISGHLSKLTGLPIDFQFQPMTFANKHHRGRRQPMGLRLCPKNKEI